MAPASLGREGCFLWKVFHFMLQFMFHVMYNCMLHFMPHFMFHFMLHIMFHFTFPLLNVRGGIVIVCSTTHHLIQGPRHGFGGLVGLRPLGC